MIRIILVRHGETKWNKEGRFQGQKDIPLSACGMKQACFLADALRPVPIDICLSSPLSRAFTTCRLCAEPHSLPVSSDARLTEINHGAWEGMSSDEILASDGERLRLWHSHPDQVTMPSGESLEDVSERAVSFLKDLPARYSGKTILVTAHDAVNQVILCHMLGIRLDHFWQIKQDNTCINIAEYTELSWRIVLLNSTAHMGYLFSGIEQKGL